MVTFRQFHFIFKAIRLTSLSLPLCFSEKVFALKVGHGDVKIKASAGIYDLLLKNISEFFTDRQVPESKMLREATPGVVKHSSIPSVMRNEIDPSLIQTLSSIPTVKIDSPKSIDGREKSPAKSPLLRRSLSAVSGNKFVSKPQRDSAGAIPPSGNSAPPALQKCKTSKNL